MVIGQIMKPFGAIFKVATVSDGNSSYLLFSYNLWHLYCSSEVKPQMQKRIIWCTEVWHPLPSHQATPPTSPLSPLPVPTVKIGVNRRPLPISCPTPFERHFPPVPKCDFTTCQPTEGNNPMTLEKHFLSLVWHLCRSVWCVCEKERYLFPYVTS